MSAAHKDTLRVGWQQQSGQFLQASSHSSGLHYPESLLANVSTACSDTGCKLNHSCFTSSWLLIHIINKPHATDSKAVMHTSHTHTRWPRDKKREALDDINERTHCKRFTDTATARVSGGTHSRASPLLSQILRLTVSTLNKSLNLLAARGWIYCS